MVDIERCKSFDASRIHGLSFHPACVVLVALSNLKTETTRMGNRDSVPREGSPGGSGQTSAVENASSLILNICGRVVMIQPESRPRHGSQSGERSDSPQLTIPTVLGKKQNFLYFKLQFKNSFRELYFQIFIWFQDYQDYLLRRQ